jgi:hypothetical protein
MPTTEKYERLAILLRSKEGEQIRSEDLDITSHEPSRVTIILTSRSSRAVEAGPLITTTDRELRRGVTILEPQSRYPDRFKEGDYYFGTPEDRPRPVSPKYGGLELADAVPSSFHMLVTAYGAVLSLLTSKPLQALTTVFALGQGIGSIRFWRHRKRDPLEGISARQALDVIRSFGGDTARLMQGDEPNLEIEMQPTTDEGGLFTIPELPEDVIEAANTPVPPLVDEVDRLSELVTIGRRLTYIRNYPDGTQDIIYLDG